MEYIKTWDKFISIEKKYNVYALEVNGIRIWDYIRHILYLDILNNAKVLDVPLYEKNVDSASRKASRRIRIIRNYFFHNPLTSKKIDYLFINPGYGRRKKIQTDRAYDIWCDPLISYLGEDKCLLMENLDGVHKVDRLSSTKNIVYTDVFALYRKFYKNKSKQDFDKNLKDKIKSIEQSIKDEFGLSVDIEPLFCKTYVNQNWQSFIFSKVLKKTKPKVVFMVCSYGKEGYIAACKDMRIPIVELQHGEISEYHRGYSYPGSGGKELFPDYFFSFGNYWTSSISLPIKQDRCIKIGYPYLDEARERYSKTAKLKQILFISTPYLGRSISKFAADLRNILPADWSIVYKLHPSEFKDWESTYPYLVADQISVIIDDKIPLYQLMAESAIQIGVHSTAIYEGVAFNCKTYLINICGVENMKKFVQTGRAFLIDNPSDVLTKIQDETQFYYYNDIFASGWKKNLDAAMENII